MSAPSPANSPLLAVGTAAGPTSETHSTSETWLSLPQVRWAILLLIAFLLLTISLQCPPVHALDKACSDWLCGWGGSHVTQFSRTLARAGSTGLYLAVPLMALVGWRCGGTKALKTYALLLAGHCLLLGLTKFTIARPRPDSTSLSAHLDSYPSGHTMIAIVLAGAFLLFSLPHCAQRWQRGTVWTATLFWPLLMGLSRIQWGRHYVTDVLGAYLLGTAWLLLCATLTRWSSRTEDALRPHSRPKVKFSPPA